MRTVSLIALVLCLMVQWLARLQPQLHFSTMPIFTPVSLQYEKELREGQAPLNIRQAMSILPHLERLALQGTIRQQDLLKFKENRKKMLDLRNKRHQLNIEMMELAVDIVGDLSKEQWEIIQSQRDALQAEVEMEIFDSALRKLEPTP